MVFEACRPDARLTEALSIALPSLQQICLCELYRKSICVVWFRWLLWGERLIFVEPYRLSKMICIYVYVVIKQKIPRPDHVQINKNGHPQLNTVLEISNRFCIAFSFCMHIIYNQSWIQAMWIWVYLTCSTFSGTTLRDLIYVYWYGSPTGDTYAIILFPMF